MLHDQNSQHFLCRLLFLFTLTNFLSTSSSGHALAETKEICRSFAVQPETFAELKFVEFKQYEDKDSGVFIKFSAHKQRLSIFKYDDGQTNITDEFMQKKLESSKKAIEKSVAKRGDEILRRNTPFVWKFGDALFYGVSYQVTYKKHDLTAFEYVGLSHNTVCMLKVRYTDALNFKPDVPLKRYKSYAREAHELFE